MRKRLVSLLKLLVTGSILVLVLREVDLRSVVDTLRAISPLYLPGIVLVALLEQGLMVAKLKIMLDSAGIGIGLWPTLRLRFVSSFLGLALPAGGADVLMVAYLKHQRRALSSSAGALLADRMMSVLSMATISAVAVLLVREELPDPRLEAAILVLVVLLWIAGGLVCWSRATRVLRSVVRTTDSMLGGVGPRFEVLAAKVLDLVENVQRTLHDIGRARWRFRVAVVLTVVVQLVRVLFVLLLFRSLGDAVAIVYVLAFVPIVTLLVLLPISFFGIGVQEGALVYFFAAAGVAPAVSLAVSLLIYVVHLTLVVGAGSFFLYVYSPEVRAAARDSGDTAHGAAPVGPDRAETRRADPHGPGRDPARRQDSGS